MQDTLGARDKGRSESSPTGPLLHADPKEAILLTGDAHRPDFTQNEAMSTTIFTPGADVITPRGRGTVIDVRATPSGSFVFGVEDTTGEVGYFTQKALQLASD